MIGWAVSAYCQSDMVPFGLMVSNYGNDTSIGDMASFIDRDVIVGYESDGISSDGLLFGVTLR